MSGEVKSAADKLAELEEALDKYESKLGLPPRRESLIQCKYIDMEEDQIRAMLPEDLETAASVLADYGLHLQRAINKQFGRVGWAESNIRKIVAKECNNVRAPSYEERRLLVIHGNEYASALDKIREQAQAALDRLNFLNRRVEFKAERLSKLSETKRRNKYG